MKSLRAVLIAAAPVSTAWVKRELRNLDVAENNDLIVGVDGGVGTCLRAGEVPDLAVGDWDSLKSRDRELLFSLVPTVSLRRDKDRSDLYFALEALRGLGISELVVLGASGGRPDHQLAAWMDLAEFAEQWPELKSIELRSEEADCFLIRPGMGKVCLVESTPFRKGAPVSVFAWGEEARGVTLEGFRYPLKKAALAPSSRGLSNQWLSRDASVRVARGTLLVVVPKLP